jgi:pre-mRNA-splicing factor ATP-dependent RNA helicase DHX38/PRP16
MAPVEDGANDYNHQLAIKLSRALNIINVNDLLAQRVTDIAKTTTVDGFINGSRYDRNSIASV